MHLDINKFIFYHKSHKNLAVIFSQTFKQQLTVIESVWHKC